MIKCNCCNAEIEKDRSFCPICGFPTLVGDGKLEIEKIAQEHRQRIFKNQNVSIKTYCYTIDENIESNEPIEDFSESIRIYELFDNKIHWFSANFESLPSSRPFDIDVHISNSMGEKGKLKSIKISPKNSISHSKIGVCMCEGLKIKFVVGDNENYAYSDEISVI